MTDERASRVGPEPALSSVMHSFSHSLHIATALDAATLDASLKANLQISDPKGRVRFDLRAPTRRERRAIRGIRGQRPTLVGAVRTARGADISPLIEALFTVLQDEADAWIQLEGIDGTILDAWPGDPSPPPPGLPRCA